MTEIHERYPLISTPFISTPFDNSVEALKKMEKLSQSASLFVKTEVNYMLMKIFLDAENTPSKAKKYASRLLEEFPDNLVYRYHYLTILKKTESPLKMQHEQEIIIQSLSKELHGLTQKQRSHFIHLITEKE
jgi:hypothetical protein